MGKEFRFVGFWKRVGMSFIDFIILILYSLIIYFIGNHILKIDPASDLEYLYYFILLAIVPIIAIYLLWKYKGASLGKLLCKVRIVDAETGYHPLDKQFLYRLLGKFISNISFLLSYIHIGIDSRKQSWHDKFSRTVVVNNSDIEQYKSENKSRSTKRDRICLRIETGFFILFSLFYATSIFFMFYDEPLLSGTKQWMQEDNYVEENLENNAFYYLAGFDCLKDDDSFQTGYEWVKNQNKKVNEEYEPVEIVFTENWTDEEKNELEKKNQKRHKKDNFEQIDLSIISENFIVNNREDVLDYYVKKKNQIDLLMVSYNFLINRYEKLNSYLYYKNTLISHYKVNAPILVDIVNIKRLKLAWIGKEYKIGNKQKAIEVFQNEMKLSRYLMSDTQTLIGKLVAKMLFELDLHLFSNLIDEANSNDLKNLLPTNLTPSEKNWKEVAMSNFNQSISGYSMYNDPSFIKAESNGKISAFLFKIHIKKIFKLNRQINETYNSKNFLYHLSQLNAKEFIAQKENYPELETSFWDKIFNPASSIFPASTVSNYHSYITKFHDIDGYINMLKLKLIIKDNCLKSQEIQSFIYTQSDSLFNPYTEDAIKWNPEKSSLYFEGPYNDDSKLKEVKIKL